MLIAICFLPLAAPMMSDDNALTEPKDNMVPIFTFDNESDSRRRPATNDGVMGDFRRANQRLLPMVRCVAQVGKEAAFLRFLKACAARTGQLLNLSDLARDADTSVNTAKSWLSLLKASFQIHLLQPYHSNVTKRLVKRPKLYFLDTGLCAYLTEWTSPETLEAGAMSGPIFEPHVFAEILKSWWHIGQFPQVYYFRNKDGKEIDLLFAADETLYPVEIKKSAAPSSEWGKMAGVLGTLQEKTGAGAVVCLCSEPFPISASTTAVPVGLI